MSLRQGFSRILTGLLCSLLCWAGAAALASARDLTGPQTLVHQGQERSYVLRMPVKPRRGQRVPLVLVLHGGGGNAANAEQMTGFTAKAAREGFIVVYPNGSGRLVDKLLTWNAGHCCAYAMHNDVDDVGFIGRLLDHLIAEYPIDARRVYVTGMSNGAMMSHRLGIELSARIAAIAPVVGAVFGDEARPAQGVAALMINGQLDVNVPYQGGPPGGRGARGWDGTPPRPALDQATFWAAANGCRAEPRLEDRPAWRHWQYSCPGSREVQLYLLKDNGHAWPGGQPGSRRGDKPSQSLNATDVIWEFFAAQAK